MNQTNLVNQTQALDVFHHQHAERESGNSGWSSMAPTGMYRQIQPDCLECHMSMLRQQEFHQHSLHFDISGKCMQETGFNERQR